MLLCLQRAHHGLRLPKSSGQDDDPRHAACIHAAKWSRIMQRATPRPLGAFSYAPGSVTFSAHMNSNTIRLSGQRRPASVFAAKSTKARESPARKTRTQHASTKTPLARRLQRRRGRLRMDPQSCLRAPAALDMTAPHHPKDARIPWAVKDVATANKERRLAIPAWGISAHGCSTIRRQMLSQRWPAQLPCQVERRGGAARLHAVAHERVLQRGPCAGVAQLKPQHLTGEISSAP